MDQKIQGGTTTPPPLLSVAPAGEREKEGGGGKKEEEEEKKRDREKEGAATVSASAGGAGAGGPGGAGTDQSHFSIKESSLSEGNVKLKIGLQAKRMKKPPKILENYVCRPAFRATVRHTGRGGGGARGNRAAATGDGPGIQSQSPSHGREKEREKSPSVNRLDLSTPSAKGATPPPPAPPPASTTTLSPSQVNGNAPAKRVRREDGEFMYFDSALVLHSANSKHSVLTVSMFSSVVFCAHTCVHLGVLVYNKVSLVATMLLHRLRAEHKLFFSFLCVLCWLVSIHHTLHPPPPPVSLCLCCLSYVSAWICPFHPLP